MTASRTPSVSLRRHYRPEQRERELARLTDEDAAVFEDTSDAIALVDIAEPATIRRSDVGERGLRASDRVRHRVTDRSTPVRLPARTSVASRRPLQRCLGR